MARPKSLRHRRTGSFPAMQDRREGGEEGHQNGLVSVLVRWPTPCCSHERGWRASSGHRMTPQHDPAKERHGTMTSPKV